MLELDKSTKLNLSLDERRQLTVKKAYDWYAGSLAVKDDIEKDEALDRLCPDFAGLTMFDDDDMPPDYVAHIGVEDVDELVDVLEAHQAHKNKSEKIVFSSGREQHNYEWGNMDSGILAQIIRASRISPTRTRPNTIADIAASNRRAASV